MSKGEWTIEARCPHGELFLLPLHRVYREGPPAEDLCDQGKRERAVEEAAAEARKLSGFWAQRRARKQARGLRPEDFL